jgi:hypothetical protein
VDPAIAVERATVLVGPPLILTSVVLACGLVVTVFSVTPVWLVKRILHARGIGGGSVDPAAHGHVLEQARTPDGRQTVLPIAAIWRDLLTWFW